MHVCIIGAGFTGLSAGYYLSKAGHKVTIFEQDKKPGGLAVGFSKKEWEWTIEEHYHHWFSNDTAVLGLAREIKYPVILKRPKTSVFVKDSSYQLDSPLHVLRFPLLSLFVRIRMAVVLALLRFNPWWQPLEKIRAHPFLKKTIGKKAYELLWEPQLKNKFGTYYKDISLAWFWARVKKRTSSLAYPHGGFLKFAEALVAEIRNGRGKVMFNVTVQEIKKGKYPKVLFAHSKKTQTFDAVIVTTPGNIFARLAPSLPARYVQQLTRLKGLGAMNLVLRLRKQFMNDGTYWLSVCDHGAPVLAVVEHTNFMDRNYYNNEHLVYVGNYVSPEDVRFRKNANELLKLYDPFLRRINPPYKKHLIGLELCKAPYAQPIIKTNYSRLIPPMHTPFPHVYLANIQQVYPWDRGTNYSVEMGKQVADAIMNAV